MKNGYYIKKCFYYIPFLLFFDNLVFKLYIVKFYLQKLISIGKHMVAFLHFMIFDIIN